MTLESTRCAIRVEGEETNEFEVQNGLGQKDSLSTFLLTLEIVIINRGINRYGTLINRSYQALAYVDDVVL